MSVWIFAYTVYHDYIVLRLAGSFCWLETSGFTGGTLQRARGNSVQADTLSWQDVYNEAAVPRKSSFAQLANYVHHLCKMARQLSICMGSLRQDQHPTPQSSQPSLHPARKTLPRRRCLSVVVNGLWVGTTSCKV